MLDTDLTGGGAHSSREVGTDWADEARPRLETAARIGRTMLRLEWVGRDVGDVFDPATVPESPAWVDVISATDRGALMRVRLQLAEPGQIRRIGFEVRDGSTEVTQRYLRKLGHGAMLKMTDEALADWAVGRFLGSAWHREVHRPGRAGRPDGFYARWAQRYIEAMKAESRSPIQRLIEEERQQGRHATAGQIRGYLNRARERSLLTASPAGRPGGELTAEGHRVLNRLERA